MKAWAKRYHFMKRSWLKPLSWILYKIGKTGYWFNQTFIPMHVRLSRWIKEATT